MSETRPASMRFQRSAVPDQITGGVFAIYGAHVGVVRNHGPVTTYGVSDMVIDRSSRECPLGVRVGRHDPIVPRPRCPERQTCARTSQLVREVPKASPMPMMRNDEAGP